MELSNKAGKYLNKLHRDKDYTITDRHEIVSYFTRHNIPLFEKVIDFQLSFSGLDLTIEDHPSSTFKARLLNRSDLAAYIPTETIVIGSRIYFYCGDHETAQFWFVLSDSGEVCTYNNNNETVNVIFSSFDKFVETYAFEDCLNSSKKYNHPFHYKLVDSKRLDVLIKDFFHHIAANDHYNMWVSKEDIVIQKAIWYDRPDYFIHIYGSSQEQCEVYVQMLKEEGVI